MRRWHGYRWLNRTATGSQEQMLPTSHPLRSAILSSSLYTPSPLRIRPFLNVVPGDDDDDPSPVAMAGYASLDPYSKSRYEGVDAKIVVMGNTGSSPHRRLLFFLPFLTFFLFLDVPIRVVQVLERPAFFSDTPKTSSTRKTQPQPRARFSSPRKFTLAAARSASNYGTPLARSAFAVWWVTPCLLRSPPHLHPNP